MMWQTFVGKETFRACLHRGGGRWWRNYFKTKNVWTFLAVSCSLFLGKRLEMLSDEKIEKCNSFLVSLFIFCFLNIIIRRFFRDINFTLRKRVILLQINKTMNLVTCTLWSASEIHQYNDNYSRRLPVQRTRSVSGVIVLFVYFTARLLWRKGLCVTSQYLGCVQSVLLLDDDKNWAIQ